MIFKVCILFLLFVHENLSFMESTEEILKGLGGIPKLSRSFISKRSSFEECFLDQDCNKKNPIMGCFKTSPYYPSKPG